MRALILVGGFGTRLQPLTISKPKPLIPFCGRPMVEWQIESLVKIGVKRIVLAIGYKEQLMKTFVEEMAKKYQIEILCSVEQEPLNTGGPIKLAEQYLRGENEEKGDGKKSKDRTFFVLNSDVICRYPLQKMLDFHLSHDGLSTLLVTHVDDPSRFGIVVHDEETHLVSQFVEKPKEYIGSYINAGMYIFDSSVIDMIELKNVSLEKEIFPKMAQNNQMYVYRLDGFWKDIGVPIDFLLATQIMLNHLKNKGKIDDYEIVENKGPYTGINLVHKNVNISEDALIGPHCVIHENVKIDKGSRIKNSVLMEGCLIGKSVHIFDSILMHDIQVGSYTRIDQQCIIAEKVEINEECCLISQKL